MTLENPAKLDLYEIFTEDLRVIDSENRHPRQVGRYGPRDLSFPCSLNCEFKYLYPGRDGFDDDTLWRFEQGNVAEAFFTRRLMKSLRWKVLGTQDNVFGFYNNDVLINGYRDIRALHLPSNAVYSFEVKFTTSFAYTPKDNHVQQHNFYLKDGLSGFLVYVNPWLDMRTYFYALDEEMLEEMIAKAHKIDCALKDGELVEPNPKGWDGKVCNYCSFTDKCPAKRRRK
jgi:hypothetical protein